jgi:hypothetical protein
LEPYIKTGRIQQPQVQIAEPLRTTAEDVYEVEKITDRRKDNNDKWEYCIKWKDYPIEENSWEPGANISANTLKAYWDSQGIGAKRQKGPKGANKRHRGRHQK